jgi:hypothetical protein
MTSTFYTGNTKYGSGALKVNNTDGGNNSAFGVAALSISTEKWNTAVGAYSGLKTTSGISNTSVGTNTLLETTSGNYNTALGTAALCRTTVGSGNTAVGSNSIEFNLTGENNTIIGTETGNSIVNGSNNICLGYKAGTSSSSVVDYSNCILIGNNVYPISSNQAIIGDGTQTSMNLVCSQNPTMSGYTVPASTDATNKIATCQWVQNAIISGGGGGSSLLTLNNTWTGTNTFNNVVSVSYPSLGNPVNTLTVRDSTSGNTIQFFPFTTTGHLGSFTYPGDSQIVSVSAPLTIMPYSSNTTVGIRLTGTSALIGAGGSASYYPTSSMLFSGTAASLTGDLTFASYLPYIRATNISSDLSIQSASGRGIQFFTNAGFVAPFYLGTSGLATFNYNVSLAGVNPTISSSDTATDLNIQSGVGRGINLYVNGGTSSIGINSTGVMTVPSTIRSPNSGAVGFTVANQLSNSGGLVIENFNTASDLYIRQDSTRSIITQVNSITQITTTATATTFATGVILGTTLTFPDSTVQTTAYTGSGPSLLASNNTWTGTNAFNNIVSINTAISNADPSFIIKDTVTNKAIQFNPQIPSVYYNYITQPGDSVIYAAATSNNNSTLTLTTTSDTNSGVRITATSAMIGAGGTSSTPTSSILFSGTTAVMNGSLQMVNGSLTFPNSTVQNTAYALPSPAPTPGTYTNASITVNSAGQITSASTGSTSNITYTSLYAGGSGQTTITIPTNVVKFDIKVFGTGGLAGPVSVGAPDGSHPDYYYQLGGTGGGSVVAYKEGIPMVKNNVYYANSLTYDNSSLINCEVKFNGTSIAIVQNGGNGTTFAGGAGGTTSTLNTTWGTWTQWNGNVGNPPTESYDSANAGQIGGGNYLGGIIGYPYVTSYSPGALNQAGQGQQHSSSSSSGMPSVGASPINYGGCIITWYLQT